MRNNIIMLLPLFLIVKLNARQCCVRPLLPDRQTLSKEWARSLAVLFYSIYSKSNIFILFAYIIIIYCVLPWCGARALFGKTNTVFVLLFWY